MASRALAAGVPLLLAPLLALAVALPLPAVAKAEPAKVAQGPDSSLRAALAGALRPAGSSSGAYVVDATDGRAVFGSRAGVARVLASNTKLFTTAAALARFGVDGTLGTEVRGDGLLDAKGVWRGDLYLRGGGDPSFGSRAFTRRAYGGGATVEELAAQLEEAGIKRVSGRIYGDESRFDSRRGGPRSGYATSIYVGPLSALAYDRGLASESGFGFQSNPPLFGAARLASALARRGVPVSRAPRAGRSPAGAVVLAGVSSPPMERLVRLTNKPSDNFLAEMLLKDLAMQVYGRGTTVAGARLAAGFARRLGSRVRQVDGSGLSTADRASPYRVVRLLLAMLRRQEFAAFYRSLSIAGRDGTLAHRMRRGPARRRCRGKTGTLPGVSALSGYCRARSGDLYVFSILMNGVNPYAARPLQDRMAGALAGVRR
jgi:D-alanyl-D-alanine carboxypeptidase/D-alanyl-D-alanine-endopeptidase (penicillin-binding protein 4)